MSFELEQKLNYLFVEGSVWLNATDFQFSHRNPNASAEHKAFSVIHVRDDDEFVVLRCDRRW